LPYDFIGCSFVLSLLAAAGAGIAAVKDSSYSITRVVGAPTNFSDNAYYKTFSEIKKINFKMNTTTFSLEIRAQDLGGVYVVDCRL
jgi:hypothetical protein